MAGAIALFVARMDGDSATLIPKPTLPLRLNASYRPPWRLLFVSLGTGCILLALEVIWFRFLRLYVASSSTAFTIMLAVVLAGIGLGSVAWGLIHRRDKASVNLLPIFLLLA